LEFPETVGFETIEVHSDYFVRFWRHAPVIRKPAMIEDAELLRRYAESRSEDAFSELCTGDRARLFGGAPATRGYPLRGRRGKRSSPTWRGNGFPGAPHRFLVGWLYRSAPLRGHDVVRAELSRSRREKEAHLYARNHGERRSSSGMEKSRPVLDQVLLVS